MPIKAIGSLSGTVADVDGDRNQRIVCRNPGLGTFGAFSAVFVTGAIAATSSSGAAHWIMRNLDGTRLFLVEEVTVSAWVVSTITTSVAYALRLIVRRHAVGEPAAPAVVWTNANQTRRAGMSGSTATIATNNTTAAGMTFVVNTAFLADSQPIGRVDGTTGTVTGTQFFNQVNTTLFSSKRMWGSYPIVLGLGDEAAITQVAAGPATGTFTIVVRVKWSEVPSGYPLIPSVANSTQLGSLANF